MAFSNHRGRGKVPRRISERSKVLLYPVPNFAADSYFLEEQAHCTTEVWVKLKMDGMSCLILCAGGYPSTTRRSMARLTKQSLLTVAGGRGYHAIREDIWIGEEESGTAVESIRLSRDLICRESTCDLAIMISDRGSLLEAGVAFKRLVPTVPFSKAPVLGTRLSQSHVRRYCNVLLNLR